MKISFTRDAYIKIRSFVDSTDLEISGYGKSHLDGDKIIVDDIIIVKQKCSGTVTDLDDESTMKFFKSKLDSGEEIKNWNIWWHSHVNMGVFWSETDKKTAEDYCSNNPYIISIVTNKRREIKARVDVFNRDRSPFKLNKKYHEEFEVTEFEYVVGDNNLIAVKERELEIKRLNNEISTIVAKAFEDDDIKNECIRQSNELVSNIYKSVILNNNYNDNYYNNNDVYDLLSYNKKEDSYDKYTFNCPFCKKEVDMLDDKFLIYDKDKIAKCIHCDKNIYYSYDLKLDSIYNEGSINKKEYYNYEEESCNYNYPTEIDLKQKDSDTKFEVTCKKCGKINLCDSKFPDHRFCSEEGCDTELFPYIKKKVSKIPRRLKKSLKRLNNSLKNKKYE